MQTSSPADGSASWPSLPLEQWQPTRDTVHLWTQIVGKTRLALGPWVNHSWGCTLYVTARGLTTSFWGAFDLAATRFSGRPAPPHPGGGIPNCPDWVMAEAYSAELSSCGYWPGGAAEGAFYSYAYPVPEGFGEQPVTPDAAYYDEQLGEFVLPYAAVRAASDPDAFLAGFLESTFQAARRLAGWPV
jgi:Family of unknown function (DUF5996)